jgi:hypothetical protein
MNYFFVVHFKNVAKEKLDLAWTKEKNLVGAREKRAKIRSMRERAGSRLE